MRKQIIISLVVLGMIAGGFIYLLNSDSAKSEKNTMLAQPKSTTDSATQPKTNSGSYVDYTDDIVSKTSGTKLLFFHASWCPQCRDLDADIKETGVPDGITIIKVDYDSSQTLRKKYGVTIQTTVVRINDNGDLVKKYVAYDQPTINAVIKNIL